MDPINICTINIDKQSFMKWISEKTDIAECDKCRIGEYISVEKQLEMEQQEEFKPSDACNPCWCYYWHDFLKNVCK